VQQRPHPARRRRPLRPPRRADAGAARGAAARVQLARQAVRPPASRPRFS